ncbi:MAG TPA: NAD(P)H-hydrate dehydratase [Nocardioidaceae bacterium]|nr:NAD(P)H-hydrate dehydratase [Nocardioidaceae bacterium]
MRRADPAVVTPALLRDWPLPEPGSGKGARGRIAVLGGTEATPGGVLLAAEASLRAGAGKLKVATVATAATTLAVTVPEAAVTGLATDDDGNIDLSAAKKIASFAEGEDAFLVGSGFCDPEASVRLLSAVAAELDGPLVVDALASAYLTEHPEGLRHLDGRVVLTVNPTELARTARRDETEVFEDPYDAALDVARRSHVVVLCGGEEKLVVTPDGKSWVVQGGSPGLGVSGSGDVQAGIVAGLVARGAEPAQAAVWGGYVHARAGERLATGVARVGYLARELTSEIPKVLAELA